MKNFTLSLKEIIAFGSILVIIVSGWLSLEAYSNENRRLTKSNRQYTKNEIGNLRTNQGVQNRWIINSLRRMSRDIRDIKKQGE